MSFIQILQIFIALALILVILLQNKGAGLGGMFGGSNNVYLSKRGLDKVLFKATIALAVAFFAISLMATLF